MWGAFCVESFLCVETGQSVRGSWFMVFEAVRGTVGSTVVQVVVIVRWLYEEVRGLRAFVRRRLGVREKEDKRSVESPVRSSNQLRARAFGAAEEARAARIRGADGTQGKSPFLLFLFILVCVCVS